MAGWPSANKADSQLQMLTEIQTGRRLQMAIGAISDCCRAFYMTFREARRFI